jgi:hypothetical protein
LELFRPKLQFVRDVAAKRLGKLKKTGTRHLILAFVDDKNREHSPTKIVFVL